MKLWSLAVPAALAIIGIVSASYLSVPAVALVSGAAAVLTGLCWPHLIGVPARKTQGAVLALVGAGATAAACYAPPAAMLTWLPAAVAVGVGAVFLIQLLRGTGQAHRLESIVGIISGVLVTAMASGWVAADRLADAGEDPALLAVAGAAALAAVAVSLIPLPDRMAAPLGLVAGGLCGALAVLLASGVSWQWAAFSGVVVAAVVMAFRRLVLSRADKSNTAGQLALALAPVLVLGPVVYFLGRLIGL
ncbi:hypothetical protein LJ754_02195 [Arthrobacter sp. zg-Y40]|uniref:hypothetical protein n=1 Tax=unclassified Arthrobacter TaxID=235627 RepID=UPI001D1461DC|nr:MULTISPECIES: hypothetical protein [unclassified Arthrobacter]MCC3276044.1 hypothetical protein [Arthrobacter sp. zg-Y20]MCC3277973.1 hypothetical protein [Arthrobacter sp. zg-Y40]MDK1316201.1 hypothetical protein [Arthrobacter sp. zg.Y20]WIB05520.1 hypothetical protein QNO06_13415 [Arthrobacter sp. zg-Y20]